MNCRLYVLLVLGLAAAGAGCASTGAVPKPFPVPGQNTPTGPTPPGAAAGSDPGRAVTHADAVGYAVAGTALSLRGAPYKNGGMDPSGFDCSGFVEYVFAQNGLKLPRTVTEQFHAGHRIAANDVQPGDLVFFSTVSPGASHVGIAIGGDEFVHAPSSKGEVRVERLSAGYWAQRFVGARRNW